MNAFWFVLGLVLASLTISLFTFGAVVAAEADAASAKRENVYLRRALREACAARQRVAWTAFATGVGFGRRRQKPAPPEVSVQWSETPVETRIKS